MNLFLTCAVGLVDGLHQEIRADLPKDPPRLLKGLFPAPWSEERIRKVADLVVAVVEAGTADVRAIIPDLLDTISQVRAQLAELVTGQSEIRAELTSLRAEVAQLRGPVIGAVA